MGPSVKFVSVNFQKNGVHFLFGKKANPGGGSEGGLVKDYTFSGFFFEPFPYYDASAPRAVEEVRDLLASEGEQPDNSW